MMNSEIMLRIINQAIERKDPARIIHLFNSIVDPELNFFLVPPNESKEATLAQEA